MEAYVHTKQYRGDGPQDTLGLSCLATIAVDVKEAPLWWHKQGLSFTASGYGARIPTPYMVRFNGRWRRVFCCIYSNNGTLFIGRKLNNGGECLIVQIHEWS